jgi:LysM repeat protein
MKLIHTIYLAAALSTACVGAHAQTGGSGQLHTIQPGETLYQLTVIYGVSASQICAANPGLSADNFRAGQVITIPSKTKSEAASRPASQSRYRDIHQVEKKETIYSISRLYGITEEELIEANPELRTEKLKKGQFVGIPYAKGTPGTKPKTGNAGAGNAGVGSSASPTRPETVTSPKANQKPSVLKVGVVLPFMTEGTVSHEEQTRMVEYYEGFLMAVDSLKTRGVNIDLYTYDTGKDAQGIQNVLAKSELKDMHLIFGPGYSTHIHPLAEFAKQHDIRLVVPFTAKNEEVFKNPAIFQINTPQSYLYNEVYEHFTRIFSNAQVIFLDPDNGDTSKQEFIRGLKAELKSQRISYKEVKGDDITPENLQSMMSRVVDNVFVPTSGQNIALIKLLPQLIVTKRDNPDYRVKLFGYPEWQTFTVDHLSNFYELDTYFYSSFYTNNLFPAAIQFAKSYRKWFSKDLTNTYPQYSMLGFDTGYFFLKAMADYGTHFEDRMNDMRITPIQTGFKFERVGTGGYVNRKVFFVHFTKDYELMKMDFE